MRDGRITQAGKYNDILNSGTDFMDLVGAHRQALSALDSKERGPDSEHTINLKSCPSQCESTDQDMHTQKRNDQNGKTAGIAKRKGQLVQEEEREKGRVGLSVYWIYVTTAYAGALVPFILLAQVLFQLLQIGSNFWMAWAAPVSKDAKAPVEGLVLILVYVALAIGSSFSCRGTDRGDRYVSTGKHLTNKWLPPHHLILMKDQGPLSSPRQGCSKRLEDLISSQGGKVQLFDLLREDLSDTGSIKKLHMPSIQRSQSSLTQCSVCSYRISSPKKNPGPSKRGHHSQPLSLLEEAVLLANGVALEHAEESLVFGGIVVEWICWLSGQRKKAPTPEEMTELEARRERVRHNVARMHRSHS
ncbi:hypothetical protein ACLOJK_039426 [Asimina triloba]